MVRISRTSSMPSAPVRVTGTVKFFNTAKGYGFITPETGGKDVFVHATALEAAGIRSLNEGDRVSFVLEDDRRGRGKAWLGRSNEGRTHGPAAQTMWERQTAPRSMPSSS